MIDLVILEKTMASKYIDPKILGKTGQETWLIRMLFLASEVYQNSPRSILNCKKISTDPDIKTERAGKERSGVEGKGTGKDKEGRKLVPLHQRDRRLCKPTLITSSDTIISSADFDTELLYKLAKCQERKCMFETHIKCNVRGAIVIQRLIDQSTAQTS